MSKLLVVGLSSQVANALVLPTASIHTNALTRAGALSMQEKQNFDNDMAGWKPPSGGGGAHTLGGEYSATDTPDFLPEEGSELDKMSKGISYTDGIMGSQVDPNKPKSTGPELAGALDSDPDIYTPEKLEVQADSSQFVLPEPSWNVNKMEVSATDYDLEMFCSSTEEGKLKVEVNPVCMTFEDYYCGFTPDSHPSFSVTPDKGTLERRNGPPTELTVTCNPKGAAGELVGYLCVILPDEKDFSTYYKITCASR
eukprot:CAMPEP_0115859078 /NCGR_PEP_ID=MMETSP0287-20121206/16428_1 /TAXON_ID=412157 /ORGANISM="Chrysochromulina rotalis, Strain UIO044" /LENGTH=253 /DNA_ID=CAMNT_0003313363 /DNA_START=32 /DNA_END=793 /DNA_ORIENTATION=+